MEGITTYILRNAFHEYYGGIDTYYTPFLSNIGFNQRELHDVIPEHNNGLHVVPQILTNDAASFLTIAKNLAALGYDEVNLNLGCPSGTVVSKKKGAGFLSVPERLDAFLDEIFNKSPLPISIKTRIGVKDDAIWPDILNIYSKYPIKELIIHPRYQKQYYHDMPNTDAFVLAQNTLDIPLAYNGNIESPEHLAAVLKKAPETDAVMIGRFLLYNPELITELRGEKPTLDLTRFKEFHAKVLAGYMEEMPGDKPLLHRMKELMFYCCHYIARCKGDRGTVLLSPRITGTKEPSPCPQSPCLPCDTSGRWIPTPGSEIEALIKKIRKAEHLPEYKAAVMNILS